MLIISQIKTVEYADISKKGYVMLQDLKSIGLKDMHPMQIEALMELIGTTLKLAANTKDRNLLAGVESDCDELVKLFGGVGVSVTVEER